MLFNIAPLVNLTKYRNHWDKVAANWLNAPDTTKSVNTRSWKVFNTDGTVWIEVDNEGYALERYYDSYGQEIITMNPDETDVPVPAGEDHDDFRDFTTWTSFLTSREDNTGTFVNIDYQSDLVQTMTAIDRTIESAKITGVQGDGLGNVEEEIEYDNSLVPYSIKKMTYDSLGRMIA